MATMVIRHFHCHPVMAADRLQPPDLIVVLKCNAVHLVCTILLQQTAQSFDTFLALNIRKNNINKVLLADSARNLFFSVFRRLINNKRISPARGFDVIVSVAVAPTCAAFTPLAAQTPSPFSAFGTAVYRIGLSGSSMVR